VSPQAAFVALDTAGIATVLDTECRVLAEALLFPPPPHAAEPLVGSIASFVPTGMTPLVERPYRFGFLASTDDGRIASGELVLSDKWNFQQCVARTVRLDTSVSPYVLHFADEKGAAGCRLLLCPVEGGRMAGVALDPSLCRQPVEKDPSCFVVWDGSILHEDVVTAPQGSGGAGLTAMCSLPPLDRTTGAHFATGLVSFPLRVLDEDASPVVTMENASLLRPLCFSVIPREDHWLLLGGFSDSVLRLFKISPAAIPPWPATVLCAVRVSGQPSEVKLFVRGSTIEFLASGGVLGHPTLGVIYQGAVHPASTAVRATPSLLDDLILGAHSVAEAASTDVQLDKQTSIPPPPGDAIPVHAKWSARHSFRPLHFQPPTAPLSPARSMSSSSLSAAASAAALAPALCSSPSEGTAADDESRWKHRIALFEDDETPDLAGGVIIGARWLPHRQGWVPVFRYAAVPDSLLGLSAGEDGGAIPLEVTLPGSPSRSLALRLSVDAASSLAEIVAVIKTEFPVDKAVVLEIVRELERRGVGHRTTSHPVEMLASVGADHRGDTAAADALVNRASAADMEVMRHRRAAREDVMGSRERWIGRFSRAVPFDEAAFAAGSTPKEMIAADPHDDVLVSQGADVPSQRPTPEALSAALDGALEFRFVPPRIDLVCSSKLESVKPDAVAAAGTTPESLTVVGSLADRLCEDMARIHGFELTPAEVRAVRSALQWRGELAGKSLNLVNGLLQSSHARRVLVIDEATVRPNVVSTALQVASDPESTFPARVHALGMLERILADSVVAGSVLSKSDDLIAMSIQAVEASPPEQQGRIRPFVNNVMFNAALALRFVREEALPSSLSTDTGACMFVNYFAGWLDRLVETGGSVEGELFQCIQCLSLLCTSHDVLFKAVKSTLNFELIGMSMTLFPASHKGGLACEQLARAIAGVHF
jgi:hypothetical protein